LDITEVGNNAKMPWQIDGRDWHTRGRVGRNGEPCRWDGQILDQVVDRIHELGEFSDTDWDSRSVVEISAKRKSDGWFFHAITGETWLLKMKFRVYRGTFQRDELIAALDLKTLNQLDDVPLYGNEPRVIVRAARGPWQEVELRVHTWAEIDTPAFWEFISHAVAGFFKFTERAAANLEDLTPWKVLGQKWHFLRKGFPPKKPIQWNADVWDDLYELLRRVAPEGQFLWNNQQVVRLYAPGQSEPWASVWTKRPDALILELSAPKGAVALGRITELGCDRELEGSRPDRDVVRLRFRTRGELHESELAELISLARCSGSK
jgi:excinuclease ABC subunit A